MSAPMERRISLRYAAFSPKTTISTSSDPAPQALTMSRDAPMKRKRGTPIDNILAKLKKRAYALNDSDKVITSRISEINHTTSHSMERSLRTSDAIVNTPPSTSLAPTIRSSSPARHISKDEPSSSNPPAFAAQPPPTFPDRYYATYKAIRTSFDTLHEANEASPQKHHLLRQLSEAYINEDELVFKRISDRLLGGLHRNNSR